MNFAVIGANYGDEGKGLMVDYLCEAHSADLVVRFNGGAQAGHTVVTPIGERRVVHHVGSGTPLGVPTFLSRFFVVNPILFARDLPLGRVYVDSRAVVTTPFDMLANQASVTARQHGTCGAGIHETMKRSEDPRYRLTVAECQRDGVTKCLRIAFEYYRCPDDAAVAHWVAVFDEHLESFFRHVELAQSPPGKVFVFEGAQGLLLDQDAADFPHVTHSHTGLRNVLELAAEWRIPTPQPVYVSRTYLTRHGHGPLSDEQPMPAWVVDPTNVQNEWQGSLRFAPLDPTTLMARVRADAAPGRLVPHVALTCLDQHCPPWVADFPATYQSFGPSRDDVVSMRAMAVA